MVKRYALISWVAVFLFAAFVLTLAVGQSSPTGAAFLGPAYTTAAEYFSGVILAAGAIAILFAVALEKK